MLFRDSKEKGNETRKHDVYLKMSIRTYITLATITKKEISTLIARDFSATRHLLVQSQQWKYQNNVRSAQT